MLEKEERYLINDDIKSKIIECTKEYKEKVSMLDISFYKDGNNLYDLYKYIVRIRKKNDKITLEVKNYKNEDECLEASINLNSVKEGIQFLKLMNLDFGIYLKRDREVRLYNDLKIFIDEFDMIGDYVEIEYQDSNMDSLNEFKNLCGINSDKMDMYGAIINEKLNDEEFKNKYYCNFEEIIKNI